ncbi:hypothetical protein EV421DRAFT_1896384 [Armillaria borealis]|uniref:F-box domain-containing protein n=1 Tax=Armillaria borealis TaxID=47425 RepID=A0AA39K4K3_9AGAR|nr:hypothetical protein EV421DRAFT_1896384 [Armillaria borealis]
MTPISPELILEILRCVGDCRDTFSVCCLVCRTWRALAQPFLFSQIQLSLESDCAPWNQKFSKYPHLADFVIILDLWGHGWRQSPPFVVLDPFLEGPATLELICWLSNVKSLLISDIYSLSKLELDALCHFTRVEHLEMHGVSFRRPEDLLHFMSHVVGLRSLNVSDTTIDSEGSHKSIASLLHDHVDSVSRRLRSLEVESAANHLYMLSWLSGRTFDTSDLTELTFLWKCLPTNIGLTAPQLSSSVDMFLSVVGAGIKYLNLGIEMRWQHFSKPKKVNPMLDHFIATAALKRFTALETLNIQSPHSLIPNEASRLDDIERLLHCVTFPNLWRMHLMIGFIFYTPDDFRSYKDLPVWANLNGLLSSPHFPSLRQVDFIVETESPYWHALKSEDTLRSIGLEGGGDGPILGRQWTWPDNPPTFQDIVGMIKTKMPTLVSHGRLEFRNNSNHRFW